MPYINVDEAYILDNTGLQVDQVVDIPYTNAALTDGQKEQARKNIGAGGTNPNLLDNPFLGSAEVVNQRGVSSGTVSASTYGLDRWVFSYGSAAGTYSLGTDGLTLTGSTGGVYFIQRLEAALKTAITGRTITLSAMLSDGTIMSVSGSYTGSSAWWYTSDGFNMGFSGAGAFQIRVDNGKTFTIRAVKMELGSVSTLANDTVPNYAEELAKCQYYCRVLTASTLSMAAVGMAISATEFRCAFPFVMRTMPTVTFSGTIQGNTSAVSAISTNGTYSGATSAVGLRFTTTGLTASAPVILYIGADAKIVLSADL